GFGGAARHLAKQYGCRVVALNLSDVENQRDRQMNRAQGLDHLVEVVDGSFESVPYPDASFDVVWSQDAFLHSGQRATVLGEVARVLKPGGEAVFTDPMQADGCPEGVLRPILERIHLETLGSPGFYRQTLTGLGLEDLGYDDHTEQLVNHYSRVLRETEFRHDELAQSVSNDYIERMKKGLRHWVDGGKKGYLAWGIFHFRKP
ncbi:MAG TPA: methyltransferase domain-containing protein, partial [Pseudodesulfovibrio sp.]|nr:methyltransferase domain-containing protein [Pseudodesulfovibrio sp.]